jgi:hypothetical protein
MQNTMETYEPEEFLQNYAQINGKQLLLMYKNNCGDKLIHLTFVDCCKNIDELVFAMKEFYGEALCTFYFHNTDRCWVRCEDGDVIFASVNDEHKWIKIVAYIDQSILQTDGKEKEILELL